MPRPLPGDLRHILVRATNWIGDAIMALPALATIRANYPQARITLLALPWVADLFSSGDLVDQIVAYQRPGRHAGLMGKWRLARELAGGGYDAAILLQNAFEAALITRLAGIPRVAGYPTDGRRLLLSHAAPRRPGLKGRHQVHYYQEMLEGLGLVRGSDIPRLPVAPAAAAWAEALLLQHRLVADDAAAPLVGLNPGAAYGPAKRWPAERYAELARRLAASRNCRFLVFGTAADREAAACICRQAGAERVIDLTGATTLAQAVAAIARCRLFVTNDSGLMHVAGALAVPLVAIFGSTDPVATGPVGSPSVIVRQALPCSPCLKTHCPQGHFRCMEELAVDDVLRQAERMLDQYQSGVHP